MRKFIFIAAIAAVLCSCGTQKRTTESYRNNFRGEMQDGLREYKENRTSGASYNQTLQNARNSEKEAGSVKRTARPTEPCEELAWERDFAAAGTATSYSEKVARNEAIRDARYQLGQMMQVAVEGAAQDYLRNATKNRKSTSESIAEEINTQFFAETVKNSKVIKTTVYDLSDGQIQVYACVEVVAGFDVLDKAAEIAKNVLTKDEELEIEFDKQKFKQDMKDGLREYKENKAK